MSRSVSLIKKYYATTQTHTHTHPRIFQIGVLIFLQTGTRIIKSWLFYLKPTA